MSAKSIFDSIKTWTDVEALVAEGREEDQYLDFKQKSSGKPDLDVDDKKILAKALSGFANTEGGVLVFGVETGKRDGADRAVSIKHIANIEVIKARVQDHVLNLVEPSVPYEVRAIEDGTGQGAVADGAYE